MPNILAKRRCQVDNLWSFSKDDRISDSPKFPTVSALTTCLQVQCLTSWRGRLGLRSIFIMGTAWVIYGNFMIFFWNKVIYLLQLFHILLPEGNLVCVCVWKAGVTPLRVTYWRAENTQPEQRHSAAKKTAASSSYTSSETLASMSTVLYIYISYI